MQDEKMDSRQKLSELSILEDLSLLTLSDDEKSLFMEDLKEVTASMAGFKELDTNGIAECSNPLDNVNGFREDEALPSYDRELILKNAPNRNNEMFIVPKTID